MVPITLILSLLIMARTVVTASSKKLISGPFQPEQEGRGLEKLAKTTTDISQLPVAVAYM